MAETITPDVIEISKRKAKECGMAIPKVEIKDEATPALALQDDTFAGVKESDTHASAIYKVKPYRTMGVFQRLTPQTEAQKEEYVRAHEYVPCILRSNIVLGSPDARGDLHFFANGTQYDGITFWHVPHSVKISLPRWVIKHINTVYQDFEYDFEKLPDSLIDQSVKRHSACLEARLVRKVGKRKFFVEPI